jgi:uncharacterized membrane protein
MVKKESLDFNTIDFVIISLVLFLLTYIWCSTGIAYSNLPENIAVHFDGLGKPNGFSLKENIWFIPAVSTLLSVGFIFVAKHQEVITFPKRKQNTIEKISNLKMMLFTAFFIAVVSSLIVYQVIKSAKLKNFEMPGLLSIIIGITSIYLTLVCYYKYKSLKS